MQNNVDVSSAEKAKLLQKKARASFVSNLQALGKTKIAFGADIMPRELWAQLVALSLAENGCITAEQADCVSVVLNSDLGNSSQLGTALLKEGVMERETAITASKSLASILAERAKLAAEKAAQPPAA